MRSVQAPAAVVLVRPHSFSPNPMTVHDNVFQNRAATADDRVFSAAYSEVTQVAEALTAAGVRVHLFDDDDPARPDSVFPNNWLSTHPGGHVAIFPMFVPNRRSERRSDVIEMLKRDYRVQDVIDYSGLEFDGIFLEGTGAMVLDHLARVAYVARSNRADPIALERFCTHFGFEPMVFDASDPVGVPIYHTNVMMCIATEYALVGLELMRSPERRGEVEHRLAEHGREVIALDYDQIRAFAGNAIELSTPDGRVLAMSRSGYEALSAPQRRAIERSTPILPLDVPTIELAGGSVRCMIAGIHLDARQSPPTGSETVAAPATVSVPGAATRSADRGLVSA